MNETTEQLAAIIDEHWLVEAGKQTVCSCRKWKFESTRADINILFGKHFLEFSRHIAEAVLEAGYWEPKDG